MEQSFSALVNGSKPVLVDFSAEWCGPCKMMAPILSELKKMMGEALTIVKIDVDHNPELSNQFQITGVPTLILFRSGSVLWRQSGVVPANQLRDIINRKIETLSA